MANPTPDFPAQSHVPTDIGSKAGVPLGASHKLVHGKIEEELKALGDKLGRGESNAEDATPGQVPTIQEDGTSQWADPQGGGSTTEFIFNSSGSQEGNRFNDWIDLFDALPEDRFRIRIQFEQDELWDTPGEYDLTRVTFVGNGNLFTSGSSINLLVADGITFSSVEGFEITNGFFFRSQSHEPLAIIDEGTITVKGNYLSAWAADYCEIFRQQDHGAFNMNLVPGGALAQLKGFTGIGYEVINTLSNDSEGLQVRFGGFGSGVMNDTVRGDDSNFIIIKEDIGYLETETTSIPGLGNLESTHENYTGGAIGRLTTVQARQLDIASIDGLVAKQVQAALEELAERPMGIADIPYQELDLTGKIFNFLTGQYLDMGTDGFVNFRWRRLGRQVEGYFVSRWGEDCDYGTFTILPADLPFYPRTPLGVEVSDFCYVQVPETSEGAGDGQLMPLGSVVTDVGLGEPIVMLVQLTGDMGDGGLNNIFYSNGNPIDLTGRPFSVYGRIRYECAEAQGDLLSIAGDFTADAEEDVAYSSTLDITTSNGDQLPITFEVTAGALPGGLDLSIDGTELTLSGTPTAGGEFTFTVTLTDANDLEYSKAFSITVVGNTPLTISIAGTFNNGNRNIPYSHSLPVTLENSGLQLPITQSVVSGAVPTGLSLSIDGSNLVLSGEPTTEQSSTFTVEIEDSFGTTYQKAFTPSIGAYNPELEALYLGTVSGNSLNIQFQNGDPLESILTYVASPGEILKIRSGTMTHDFGEGPLNVPVGGFIIFEGGFWREYIY